MAEYYYEQHLPVLDRLLSDETRSPLTRLRRYFEALMKEYRQGGWAGGCLLGMLGQELADRDAGARDVLAKLFGRWRQRLAACLREARDQGELEADAECDELAGFLLDGWEGALIRMKLKKSGAPLEEFIRVAFDRVLAARVG